MSKQNHLEFTATELGFPILFVLLIWIVYWVEVKFGVNFNTYGIYPRKLLGLRGIVFSPFIHGSLKHLFSNSIPLLVLSTALFYFYRDIRWKVLFYGFLLTGILTWIIGRPALHIGASGVVYMLVAFIFFKGIFSKQYQLTALSLVVVFLYGGLLWYVFPVDPKISWEGHLSGFFVGFLLAFIFKSNPIENKKYDWEREDFNPENDPFISQFDDDGNFIEIQKEVIESAEESKVTVQKPSVKIVYTFREDSKKEEG